MQQTGELEEISVRDLTGLRIGNAQDDQAKTGVTVLLFDKGAKVGVEVSGGGPASRETHLADPTTADNPDQCDRVGWRFSIRTCSSGWRDAVSGRTWHRI